MSKIQNKRVTAKEEINRSENTNPFNKTVSLFFDSEANCKQIFKDKQNILDSVTEIKKSLPQRKLRAISASTKAQSMKTHKSLSFVESLKDARHSYYDLKLDLPDKN